VAPAEQPHALDRRQTSATWTADGRAQRSEFERLYADSAEQLLTFLACRTGDRRLAEDLTADTFERVLRTQVRWDRRKASEKTWLFSIALNLLRDQMRRNAVHERSLTCAPEARGEGPSFVDAIGARDSVQQALATLSDEERDVIALRFGSDSTFPEIARLLGQKLTTVESRTHRALHKLKEQLQVG
jgi:RNA polymerase sigma-70 factor (ECF subfamily)